MHFLTSANIFPASSRQNTGGEFFLCWMNEEARCDFQYWFRGGALKGAPLNIFDVKSEVSSILEAESRRLQVRSRA